MTAVRVDLLKLSEMLWPKMVLYSEQREIVRSVQENDETVVPAGNGLGKDFTAGHVVLLFFLSRHPCRIVTTSAKDRHLDVLWGEIGAAIDAAAYPLRAREGAEKGGLIVNHHRLRKVYKGQECPISYVVGMVASEQTKESFQGHHVASRDELPHTMFVADEASSLPDRYYDMAVTWAKRRFIFGNTWPCENFFKRAVKGDPATKDPGGDIPRDNGNGFHRKVIKITADDSPNVRRARELIKIYGKDVMKRRDFLKSCTLIPGVIDWAAYQERRKLRPKAWQTVSMDAEWYEGPEEKMYPLEWRKACMDYADELEKKKNRRTAKSVGIDTGEGKADTSMYAVDDLGIVGRRSMKTPDTSKIEGDVLGFCREVGCPTERAYFDRGGGGKQIADYMRSHGHQVNTVAFGEPVSIEKRRGVTPFDERKGHEELRTTFVSRRCQLYWLLREVMDPGLGHRFGIPREYVELYRQMGPIPLKYDDRGRVWLPPKQPRPRVDGKEGSEVTLIDLVGCSPDELEALALAVYGLHAKPAKRVLQFEM